MDPFIYLLPSTLNQKKLQKTLPETPPYKISYGQDEQQEGVLLDTFDAEVFQSAKILFQHGNMLLLIDLQTGRLLQQAAPATWSFAGDLPVGPVTAFLQQLSKLRAFLPIASVGLSRLHGLLLDDEGKTRARLHHLTISHGRKSVGIGITEYLRGYRKAHDDLRHCLERIGAISCQSVGQVYRVLGIKQGKYNAKPVIELHREAPVKDTARTIISVFLQTARANEKGLIGDYDTEFLHDYRVSLRKVRSLLSLFTGVYSPEETAQLKKDFSSLMQNTNALRDLDVYLLNKLHYFSLVPAGTHEGLAILFDYLSEQRKKEHSDVIKVMRSKNYRKEIGRLEKMFTNGSNLATGPKGEEHSMAFACRLICKRYDKVCKIARDIDAQTEDETIHQLRINCKKLRYLMEFFSPLFPEDEIVSLIKALKILQDNLGNFNDYSVQQTFLRHILQEKMADFGSAKLKVAESVGALTAILHRLQKKERRQVVKNFARFDSPETRAAFTKLFHTPQIEEGVDENNSLLQ